MDKLLADINSPHDLRKLREGQLNQVADELRTYILDTITKHGGHLSSNLGTIELTIALHYVFDTPQDQIIWDVGHQSYAHKVVTGRREQLAGIRKKDGISGFPQRSESDYDAFGTAHASTSISAAFGMVAGNYNGKVVAVIGDGALSGGMAFEALNNAGAHPDKDLLVILNDNDTSISPAVGAIRQNLARILASNFYNEVRKGSTQVMPPSLKEFVSKAEEHIKGMVLPGTLFEELGFNYFGPIDGHNIDTLISTLRKIKDRKGPKLLHIATVKGKGFQAAEEDPVKHHGVSAKAAPLKVETTKTKVKTYSQIFGDWLCHAAKEDSRVYGITPAMREGSGLVEFAKKFPNRYFDCGIAEQHAVTFSAGLACSGQKPVLAIYSTFLQRGYDQLIHDVAIQNLPVVFAVDRAGFVGADGATHHGAYDLSFLRCIPNLQVMTPANEAQMWLMLNTALQQKGPALVRYPRGSGTGIDLPQDKLASLEVGKAKIIQTGSSLALLCFGPMLNLAQLVADELNATLVDMRFVKPIDKEMIQEIAATHSHILTIEENVVAGGAGSAVAETLTTLKRKPIIQHLGIPDFFIDHASPNEQLAMAGLTTENIKKTALQLIAEGSRVNV